MDGFDKASLVQKVNQIQANPGGSAKWQSFCQLHEASTTNPSQLDEPFLATFLDAYNDGEIAEMEGANQQAMQAMQMMQAQVAGGNDFSGGKGAWSGGKGDWSGGKGGGDQAAEGSKIFVGGLPKALPEDAIKAHFEQNFGQVVEMNMKYTEDGQARGFCFVTFANPADAEKVLANYDNNRIEGKWVDCKAAATQKGMGKGVGGKDGGGKGKKGKGGKGGGWGGFDGGWGGFDGGWGDWGFDPWSMMGMMGGFGKGFGKGKKGDKGKGKGFDKGKGKGEGGKGKGKDRFPPEKIFVGGLPKSASEESVRSFFSNFGTIAHVDLKYDDMGGFRGFGFVQFQDVASAQAVVANGPNNMFDGKWIDCKPVDPEAQKGDGGKGKGKFKGKDKGKMAAMMSMGGGGMGGMGMDAMMYGMMGMDPSMGGGMDMAAMMGGGGGGYGPAGGGMMQQRSGPY